MDELAILKNGCLRPAVSYVNDQILQSNKRKIVNRWRVIDEAETLIFC